MKIFLSLISLIFLNLACGSDVNHSDLKTDYSWRDIGLKGHYQTGSLKGHHFFIHLNDQISAKAGFRKAVNLVNDKKTLKPNRTFKVRLKDKQLLTVGYYISDRFFKFYEFFLVGEDVVYGDRYIQNFDNQFIDSFESSGRNRTYKLMGDLTVSPTLDITYEKDGVFTVRVNQ